MLLVALAAWQLTAAAALPSPDTLPTISLPDAIARATHLDPAYVDALGQLGNAEWVRRAARLAFVLPSVAVGLDATRYSGPYPNALTGLSRTSAVTTSILGTYELFGLHKFTDLAAGNAAWEAAAAGELGQRFQTAMATEADYYSVLANQELLRVAADRLARAREQLTVSRARVTQGAAVQSDSLQVAIEATRAAIDSAQQAVALEVAQLQLGRRVGLAGPVAAQPLDSMVARDLPLSLDGAVALALDQGPEFRIARANEAFAAATLHGQLGGYLPDVVLGVLNQQTDTHWFPTARNLTSLTLGVTIPLWGGGEREIALAQAREQRDVAAAIRADRERGARRDVTESYMTYTTARDNFALSEKALVAAQENFRVEDQRYRAGAATILELLDAQLQLTQASADLVQTRYSARLALAGLETILGRRLL